MRLPGASQPAQDAQIWVLVIEDEAAIRETIALTLRAEGYQVLTTADGQQALELLRLAALPEVAEVPAIDLIILDLMLPYISGLDVCRIVRQ